jgi:hypothetical protein
MSTRRLFALLSLATAPLVQAQTQDLGEGFLCCNMRANGSWISDSNYEEDKATVVRVGTPLKHDGFGRYRVHVLIDGKRSSIGNDYSAISRSTRSPSATSSRTIRAPRSLPRGRRSAPRSSRSRSPTA